MLAHACLAALLLTADPAGPPSPGAEQPAAPVWKATISAGLMYAEGNAFGLTGTLAASGERASERWILSGRLSGAYGVARASGETAQKTSAYAAGLRLRADRRFSPQASAYALAGADTDHVASLEWRPFGEAGFGYIWFDAKSGKEESFLRTDLGFRVSQDFRFQYYPSRMQLPDPDLFLGPRVGLLFRHQFASGFLVSEEVEFLPGVRSPFRYLFGSVTKASVGLLAALRFGLALAISLDGAPAPGKQAFDSALTVTLDYVL